MSPIKIQISVIISVTSKNATLPDPVVATLSFSADIAVSTDGVSMCESKICTGFKDTYKSCELAGDHALLIEKLKDLTKRHPEEEDILDTAQEQYFWMKRCRTITQSEPDMPDTSPQEFPF